MCLLLTLLFGELSSPVISYLPYLCFTIYLYISLGFLIIIGLYTTLGYSVHFVYYCTVRQEIYQLLRGVAVVHYGDR